MRYSFPSRLILAAFAALLTQPQARAAWPTDHPITAIIPFPAGSSNDIVGRIISPHLAQALGTNIIDENKPGADSLIGMTMGAEAKPDGYTILFIAGNAVLTPALHKTIPYDPATDLMGVASLGIDPYIIAASNKLNITTLKQLIAALKAAPGKLNAPAPGSSSRMIGELFKQVSNTQFALIGYEGTNQAFTSLLGGETDFGILDSASFDPKSQEKVKLLAVANDKRIAGFPDLPTTAEAGLPGYTAAAFYGLYMPGHTPPAITDRVNAEVNKILTLPDVVAQLQRLGTTPNPTTRQQFDAKYHSDLILWKQVVVKAGIPLVN